jgi:hypothetical protein
MAAYYKVDVSLNTNSVTVGSPSAQEVLVTLPLVGPAGATGATGATGASGASTWNEISGKPATFPPSAHEHQPDEVYADAAFVSQSGDSSLQIGIYLHNGTDNGRPVYESPTTGDYIWWDSNLDQWYLTSNTDVNLYYLDENADEFPWETDVVWNAIPPQTGNIEVDQAFLSDISDYGVASVIGLKTSKSGNASSTELVLGSDTRLTNSRTPSSTLAHAASHHTGGSDALTPANIGAAPAVNVIELEADGTTTITTAQLPARGIAYAPEGESTYTVNLPTPDIRQSGLTFSLKTEYEEGSGTVFVTVVHAAVNLLTTYELDEDEGSIDFLWDGYAWTYDTAYRLRSFPSRVLQLPAASGTIARTEDFAAPPAIGSTTPNSGAFTSLSANNGTLTASAPVLDLSQTWNNAAVTFTGLLANFTNTASGSASKALDIKINGTSVVETSRIGATIVRRLGANTYTNAFEVRRDGSVVFSVRDDGIISTPNSYLDSALSFQLSSATGLKLRNIGPLQWASGSNINAATDLVLLRDGANTLAQRSTTNPQVFRIYNTFTDASNYERGFMRWSSNVLQIGTEKGSVGGSARVVEFHYDGTAALRLISDGVNIRQGNYYGFASSGIAAVDVAFQRASAGVIRIIDNGTNNPPALRIQNANNSTEYAALRWASNEFIFDANAGSGTLRGIKLGSASTSLLGFFGATPVDQPALTADLLDSLQEVGLVASGSGDTPLNLSGGTLTAGNLVLTDNTGAETATFDAQAKLTDNRTYDLPDSSGTIALLETLPAGGPTNLWIPASAWIPKTTAGCGVDSRETATNDQNFDELLFDTGADELADALVIMPSNYNNGTVTARFYWTAASGSGGVVWAIQGRAFANDDALDTAAGTAQLVTDTLIAADDMHVTSATSAVTLGGTPAANTPIQFTIYRDVSDAGDDLGVDARLLGVEIIYTAA